MPRKTTKLELRKGDFEYLRSLIKQRTIQAQVVIRAHILLDKANGVSIREIAAIYDLSPNTVRLCINKYEKGGTDFALFDGQRSGRPIEITDEAKSWIISVACQKPCDLGYSAELWTLAALAYLQKRGISRISAVSYRDKTIYTKTAPDCRHQAF